MKCLVKLFSLAIIVVASACGPDDILQVIVQPPVLVSLTFAGDTNSMVVGTIRELPFIGNYSDGSTKSLSASAVGLVSSNPSVVAVTAPGVVTAVGPGDSKITASFDGKTVVVHIGVLPLPVTVVSVSIVGDTILEAPGPLQLRAIALKSDGTEEDVTELVTWSYPNSDYLVGEVNSTGLVTPNGLGSMQVTVSYQGHQGSHQVTVVGTPWSQLPPLSAEARAWVKSFVLAGNGMLWRWMPSGPISLWANPGFESQSVVDAVALWKTATSKVEFVIVTDSTAAQVILTFDPSITQTNICGWEGPFAPVNNIYVQGLGRYRPGCVGKAVIAHGLGHILGLLGHTASGVGVMSFPSMSWRISPLIVEVVNWMPSVSPGTIPIDG